MGVGAGMSLARHSVDRTPTRRAPMRTMRLFRLALPLAAFVVTATLAVGPVKAQQVDTKGESELTSRGQQIDKTAAAHDPMRVTARIVDDWKGKTFKFDARKLSPAAPDPPRGRPPPRG